MATENFLAYSLGLLDRLVLVRSRDIVGGRSHHARDQTVPGERLRQRRTVVWEVNLPEEDVSGVIARTRKHVR